MSTPISNGSGSASESPGSASESPSERASESALETPSGPEIGAHVQLRGPVPYLKTADPMPMLRPPDLVDSEEIGVVVERRARDQLAVRFRRGTFLLTCSQLEPGVSPREDGR